VDSAGSRIHLHFHVLADRGASVENTQVEAGGYIHSPHIPPNFLECEESESKNKGLMKLIQYRNH
jgi:hypothetical protein